MIIKPFTSLALLIFTQIGCTETDVSKFNELNVPKFSRADYIDQADLLYSIQCELKDAVDDVAKKGVVKEKDIDHTIVLKQKALITMQLKGVENTDLDGNATFVVPVGVAALTLGAKFGAKREATATNTFEIEIESLSELARCPDVEDSPTEVEKGIGIKRLKADIGLKGFISQTTEVFTKIGRYPASLGYTVTFEVASNGSFSPSIKRTNSPSIRSQTGGGSVSGGRTLTHTFTIAVSDFDKSGAKRQSVDDLRKTSTNLRFISALEQINN